MFQIISSISLDGCDLAHAHYSYTALVNFQEYGLQIYNGQCLCKRLRRRLFGNRVVSQIRISTVPDSLAVLLGVVGNDIFHLTNGVRTLYFLLSLTATE